MNLDFGSRSVGFEDYSEWAAFHNDHRHRLFIPGQAREQLSKFFEFIDPENRIQSTTYSRRLLNLCIPKNTLLFPDKYISNSAVYICQPTKYIPKKLSSTIHMHQKPDKTMIRTQ